MNKLFRNIFRPSIWVMILLYALVYMWPSRSSLWCWNQVYMDTASQDMTCLPPKVPNIVIWLVFIPGASNDTCCICFLLYWYQLCCCCFDESLLWFVSFRFATINFKCQPGVVFKLIIIFQIYCYLTLCSAMGFQLLVSKHGRCQHNL